MEIVICPDIGAVGQAAADSFERVIQRKPAAVLGLATGSSPVPLYDELESRSRNGQVSFRDVRAFSLDEYIGLPVGHPETYKEVVNREFTTRMDIDPARVLGPNGNAPDLKVEAADFERAIINAGGIDVQVLGIGSNGHIGFNEPGSSLGSRTRVKTLLPTTRRDNARFFNDPDDVPHHVITQGIGTIMEARRIVLMATGEQKAEAIARLVEGPISAMCPGSILQLHPNARVILDEAAASQLALADYYRYTYENKPVWQRL
ncbi:glucosamine-6-phosphate deaminase [Arthrobacter sp. 2MCAF15]|uniref:glucosamine-6-phosphate deaminase n=1 Tax=Arthrobacter sp. 2MCAF15 TaxID=3232984 RepID=UPI003F90EFAF